MAVARIAAGVLKRTLAQIDEVLAAGGPEAKKLWDVMSALRGPDDAAGQAFKQDTTNIIRAAAFPKTASKNQLVSQHPGQTIKTAKVTGTNAHFGRHVRDAAVALGLDIDDRS